MNDSKLLTPEVEKWIDRRDHDNTSKTELAPNLTIVIPAYNEQWRLPTTLIDIIDFMSRQQESWEVIVIDDGSTDRTCEAVRKFQNICPALYLISSDKNYGKGHAVRQGMLASNARLRLFCDADGSTPIAEYLRLRSELDKGADLAIGSRALASKETQVVTKWYRKYPGRVFNFCVNKFILPGFADTQCGFKLFTGEAAEFLFGRQTSNQFSFDLEILYLAKKAGLKVAEVPVNWENVAGSKVNLLIDAAKMLRDIFVFRVRHYDVVPGLLERNFEEPS